jgi:hypothetical protein
MGNSPQFSNTNMKFQRPVSASEDNLGQKVKISVWLNFDNGWDDEMKRPHPPTESQQKSIEDIHKQIKDLGMELSVQLQGDNQMNIARTRAFCNEPRYETKSEVVNGFDDL